MNCVKDVLEIAYYVAFIVLTWKIVQYSRKTYELEASKKYELLCKLNIMEETTGDYVFGYALEIYNAGNDVAKNIEVQSFGKHITTIDFVKPGSSTYYPLGRIMRMMGANTSPHDNDIKVESGKPLNVVLIVDGNTIDYSLSTDILFATRDNVTGTLKGIEDELSGIKRAIDTEYQRRVRGY